VSKSLLTVAASAVVVVLLQGCAHIAAEVLRDPRDAPWDPVGGRALFEQLPPHISKAHRECCSALSRSDFLRMRCDTDRPVPPRTNRC
jgi:hypothetical protein